MCALGFFVPYGYSLAVKVILEFAVAGQQEVAGPHSLIDFRHSSGGNTGVDQLINIISGGQLLQTAYTALIKFRMGNGLSGVPTMDHPGTFVIYRGVVQHQCAGESADVTEGVGIPQTGEQRAQAAHG